VLTIRNADKIRGGRCWKPFRKANVADKSSFTKEEWTLLLESPMLAGMAITAADPSGLWGLLKESFAGGSALAKVMADPGANPLVKALANDFSTSEARSTARDGLKAKFANSQPADVKTNRSKLYARFPRCWQQRPQAMRRPSRAGSVRLAKVPPKPRARVVACSALAGFRLATPRKRPLPKFPPPSVFEGAGEMEARESSRGG
jgi:hypothetical protein